MQMELRELLVESQAMARRELIPGVLAHNLEHGGMLLAATRGGQPLTAMSIGKARARKLSAG